MGQPGWAGQTFGFLGIDADKNCGSGSGNVDGFVNPGYRCSRYDGIGNNWYSVSSGGTGTCSDPLTGPSAPSQ